MLTTPNNNAHDQTRLSGPCVLWDQQEEFVDLLLQYLLDADPCCNPYVERAQASPPPKRTKCFDEESVYSSVLDQNRTSALSTSCTFKHGSLLTTRESPDMMDCIHRCECSVDDGQITCAQNSLPPPMPFVRNGKISRYQIKYDATAPARHEYNLRIGQSLHSERLHVLSMSHQKIWSNML